MTQSIVGQVGASGLITIFTRRRPQRQLHTSVFDAMTCRAKQSEICNGCVAHPFFKRVLVVHVQQTARLDVTGWKRSSGIKPAIVALKCPRVGPQNHEAVSQPCYALSYLLPNAR
jgi:hypothetical protein